MVKTSTRSQSRSIGLVGLVNILNALVGVLQALAVGSLFGTSVGIETYFVSVAFYQSILKLTQTGQIAEIFTPYYHSLKSSKGQKAGFDLLSVLLTWLLLISLLLSAIIYSIASYITPFIAPGFSPERIQTCTIMFQLIIPLLSLKVIETLVTNLLVGEKQFVAPQIIRLLCAVMGLALILCFNQSYHAWVMIGALWLTSLSTLVLLGILLYRLGYRYTPRLSHKEFSIREIFKNIPSIFSYVCFTQIYTIAITAGLTTLPQGSLAVFTYAQKISSRVNGVLMQPLSIVFFNHYSSALASGEESVKKLADQAIRIAIVVSTIALVATISGGFPGLKALWLSDIFPEAKIFQTYILTVAFCILPLINALGLIYRKINMSHKLIKHQYTFTTAVQIISAPLAYYAIPYLGVAGAIGLVLFNGVAMATVSGLVLKSRLPNSFLFYKRTDILKCSVVLLVSITPILLFQFLLNLNFSFAQPRLANLASCLAYSLVGILTALLCAKIVNLLDLSLPEFRKKSLGSRYV